jgi:hypothetical protein
VATFDRFPRISVTSSGYCAALDGHEDITVIFAGYHTPKPKYGLGDYRTIGRVSLHSSQQILAGSNDAGAGDDGDNNGN